MSPSLREAWGWSDQRLVCAAVVKGCTCTDITWDAVEHGWRRWEVDGWELELKRCRWHWGPGLYQCPVGRAEAARRAQPASAALSCALEGSGTSPGLLQALSRWSEPGGIWSFIRLLSSSFRFFSLNWEPDPPNVGFSFVSCSNFAPDLGFVC